ncbi:MAG: ABC transporter permease subunit [Rhodospirillales bacterium]
MSNVIAVTRRELAAYFSTPLAYVFIVIFLALAGAVTFYFGQFFDRGQSDLQPFFSFHPWLYLFLIPAVGMRLWAEERKSGTLELLLTLPLSTTQAVIGKFLAAWIFAGIALALTFPLWITVNYLGTPDNGIILAGYIGSFVMAGAFLAIGSFVSAMTKNQVIAFVIAAAVCFLFMMTGLDLILSAFRTWAPPFVTDLVASLSFLTHFDGIAKGAIDLRNVVYMASIICLFLFANTVVVDLKKGA